MASYYTVLGTTTKRNIQRSTPDVVQKRTFSNGRTCASEVTRRLYKTRAREPRRLLTFYLPKHGHWVILTGIYNPKSLFFSEETLEIVAALEYT